MEEIYSLVGKIIETAQYLEYNLIIMVKYEKILQVFSNNETITKDYYLKIVQSATEFSESLKRKTLGEIIFTLNEMNTLSSEELKDLEKVLRVRNYLVHQYFKDKDFENQMANINKEISYLTNTLQRMHTLNVSIANVILYQQNLLKSIN